MTSTGREQSTKLIGRKRFTVQIRYQFGIHLCRVIESTLTGVSVSGERDFA